MDAVVFAAAAVEPTVRLRAQVRGLHDPFVVAADGGAEVARAFGLRPDVVIGDFDSLPPEALAAVRASGSVVEPYPRDKNATDGQLAIERALAENPASLLLIGFLGGPRLDQATANLLLLSRLTVPTRLVDAYNQASLLRGRGSLTWSAEPNEIVSLIPLTDEAVGVTTAGLRWPLHDATLGPGQTRGVSNEPLAETVSVWLKRGSILVTRFFPEG